MVNRKNWQAIEAYLKFKYEVAHRQKWTIVQMRFRLRHLLEWADETHFTQAAKLRPTYPEYLNAVRRRDGHGLLTDNSISLGLSDAVQFSKWARERLPDMRGIETQWIDTLQPIRRERPIVNERQAVTLETMRALMAVDWPELIGRRTKAAAAFLFLSGMRATAFVTLPIKAVNIQTRTVQQNPALGVKTKFRKRATTLLLDIPELLEVVSAWDAEVRKHAGPDDYWFFRFGNTKPQFTETSNVASRLETTIKELFERAGLKPMSPHKFRHGHATYALKLTQNMADYKAVSQNLMHANMGITDSIYAILSESDMRERIEALGKATQPATPQAAQPQAVVPDIAAIVEETVKRMMREQADQAGKATQPATPHGRPKTKRKRKA